jgi:phosphate transport system substrate-binding protein
VTHGSKQEVLKQQSRFSKGITLNITRFGKPMAAIAIAAGAALALSSCASSTPTPTSTLSGVITGGGSSAQGKAQTVWQSKFQAQNPNVTVNYAPVGSGAGITNFIAGGVNTFAGSDSILSAAQLAGTFAACKPGTLPFEVPNYISAIAVAYNVSGVTSLNLDAATLAGIFSGAITTWNDPKIAALNSGVNLPSAAISAVHRSDSSGTTNNFTDYLAKVAPTVWTNAANNVFPAAYKGESASGNAGVASAIANGTNTIGYVELSYLGKLNAANIKVGDKFVAPSNSAGAAVVAGSPLVAGRDKTDMAIAINRTTTDSTQYPLVLVSYLIGCNTYLSASVAALDKAYFQFILSPEGQKLSETSGDGAALSTTQANAALAIVNAIQ